MLNAKDHPLALKNGKKYSDIFVYAINFSYTYLIYYQMIQEGIVPTVHLFEDGLSSYCEELLRIEHSNIDHSVFSPEKRIANNIKESLLYMPDWYCGAQKNFPKNILPRKADFAVIMPYLNMIFEKPELPKEKYIYFDEGCIQEGTNNNECGILDYISEIVGKENIIVKLHPRAPDNNDYFMRGYKTFKTGITPWELFLDLDGIDNKVIMAISSTCLFSDYSIYGKKINSIQFYNISLNHRIYINNHKPIVDAFFKKIYKDINSEQKQLFVPNSLAELECCIKYLEGEME